MKQFIISLAAIVICSGFAMMPAANDQPAPAAMEAKIDLTSAPFEVAIPTFRVLCTWDRPQCVPGSQNCCQPYPGSRIWCMCGADIGGGGGGGAGG